MARIAVEDSLDAVKQALQNSGHEVVSMDNLDNIDCAVISGLDNNVMGISDRATKASVIDASGMTADEVVRRVDQSLKQTQS